MNDSLRMVRFGQYGILMVSSLLLVGSGDFLSLESEFSSDLLLGSIILGAVWHVIFAIGRALEAVSKRLDQLEQVLNPDAVSADHP